MLLNLLLIFILIVICPLIFNYTLTLNLTCYILVVISIFLSLIYSIMTYTFPWSMFVTFIIISIIMLFKHRYLSSHTSSRLFIKKLLSFSYIICTLYISTSIYKYDSVTYCERFVYVVSYIMSFLFTNLYLLSRLDSII